jgi:uncharacterized protein YjiS (DUF1127 family)
LIFLKAVLMPDVLQFRSRVPSSRGSKSVRQGDFEDRPPAVPARGLSWARLVIAGTQRARALRSLDDHLLRDIGLTRDDVEPALKSIMAAYRRLCQL